MWRGCSRCWSPQPAQGSSDQLRRAREVLPKLGKLRIDKLTAARVQGWGNMLVDAGQAAGTVRDAYLRLRGMLDVAVRYRLISANPAKEIDLPPLTNDRACALSLSEARTLLRAADGELDVRAAYTTKDGRTKSLPKVSSRHTRIYHMLLALGLRRGEVLECGATGLRTPDLLLAKTDWAFVYGYICKD